MDRFEKLAALYKSITVSPPPRIPTNDRTESTEEVRLSWMDEANGFFQHMVDHFVPDRTDPESMRQVFDVFSAKDSKAKLDAIDFTDADQLRNIDPFLLPFMIGKKAIQSDKLPFDTSSGRMPMFERFAEMLHPWTSWMPPK